MMKHLFFGALLLFGSLYSPMAYASTDAMDEAVVGSEAPDFVLRTLMRDKQSLKELIKGKKSIVFFWATWCPYCRKEIAAISKNMPDIQKKGIQFVFVNVGEAPNKVRSFLEKNKIEADVFLDENSTVAEKYRVVGLPTFVYVNKNGVINQVENGLLDDYEQVLLKE
jgi:peroxiredoxin